MTGFARAAAELISGTTLTLTLRSLNHRFLDLHLRLPPGCEHLEPLIRTELKRLLIRGHIECTLTLDPAEHSGQGSVAPVFNLPALRTYLAAFQAAAREHGLSCQPDLNTAALLPGMLVSIDTRSSLEPALAQTFPTLLAQTTAALTAMRAHEGAVLAAVMADGLARLATLTERTAALRENAQDARLTRLSTRLRALLGTETDPNRLLSEAAILAERADIDEELARLRTHIAHFRALLGAGGEAGKKLDFLLQELNREANTILSKTAGVTGGAAEITEAALAMKSEIEKLREQAQNIE